MLIFAEYLAGLQEFGERVLPLMRTAKLAPPRPPRVWAEELPLELNRPLMQRCHLMRSRTTAS
jgi:hypothetical protein